MYIYIYIYIYVCVCVGVLYIIIIIVIRDNNNLNFIYCEILTKRVLFHLKEIYEYIFYSHLLPFKRT